MISCVFSSRQVRRETRPASRRQGDKMNVFFWAGPARGVQQVAGVHSSLCCRRCLCRRWVLVAGWVALDACWWQSGWLSMLVDGRWSGGYQCSLKKICGTEKNSDARFFRRNSYSTSVGRLVGLRKILKHARALNFFKEEFGVISTKRRRKKHEPSLQKLTFCLRAHWADAHRIVVNKIKVFLVSLIKITSPDCDDRDR